jgi:hypothetical protein
MKRIKIILRSTIVLFAIIALNACSDVQKELSSSIIDGKGLSIDLDWTTRSNVPTALIEADLDLDVYKGDGEILSSYNSDEFEHVDLTNLFEDGAYTVKVSLYEIRKRSDYTLKIKGAANGKTFKVSGFFKGADDQPSVSVLKITKAGERFTLSTL